MSGTRRGSVSSFGTLELFANLGVEHDDNGDDDEVQVQERDAKERRDKGKEEGENEEEEDEEDHFVTAHSAVAAADSKGDIWSFSPPKSASKSERKRVGDVETGDVEGKVEGKGEGEESRNDADIVVKGVAYVSTKPSSRRSSSRSQQQRKGSRSTSGSLRDSTSEKADPPGANAAAAAEDEDGTAEAPHGSRGRLNSSYRAGAHLLNASASSTHSDHDHHRDRDDDEGTSPWSMMEEVEAELEASVLGTEASRRRWSSGPGGGEGGDDDYSVPRIESGVVVDRHRPSADRRRTSVGTDDGDADAADAEEAHAVVDIDAAVTDTNVDAIPRDRVVAGGRPGGGRLGGDLARTLGGLFGVSKVQDGSGGGKADEESTRDHHAADASASDEIPLGGAMPRDVPSGKVIDPGGKELQGGNKASSKCWRQIRNNRIWICGVVVAMCLVVAAETAELLLGYKIGGEPTAEEEGEDNGATEENNEGAIVVSGGPGGGGIRPPSVPPDLYDICSEARVHSSSEGNGNGGYAACRRICEGGECCYLPPDHALSCASEEEEEREEEEGEEDPCGIFVRTCAVLDGIGAAEKQTTSANK